VTAARAKEVATMRVLTLNIWARNGPYATRQELLRHEVSGLAPDLIALQEVDAGPGESNQAAELFEPLGYRVAYERREGEYRADPGIAVASRHPIREQRLIELPHGGAAVAARIDAGGDPFWFCSAVPMPIWPHQEGGREDEAVALDTALTELADGDELPPILAGDFDATPDAASIRFLTGRQSLQGRSTHWMDAFALAGTGAPGWTWTVDNPYVAPFAAAVYAQSARRRRIDYVFVGSPFRWRPRVVVRSCRIAVTGTPEAAPSDHYGVVADLEIDPAEVRGGRGLETWDETAAELWPPET
jgi:endonuclease/exonuclease/phosphatase family metal-dependent hydrolase